MNSPARNAVVARLGTPDRTSGSVNNPIIREEDGCRFNEKWEYDHLLDDPSGMPQRVVYWHRYDLVATRIRAAASEQWRDDSSLVTELAHADPRLSHLDLAANPRLQPSAPYRRVSEFKGKIDLGGYREGERED